MSTLRRLIAPPKSSGFNPITVNGRIYDVAAGAIVDVEYPDANVLGANHWTVVAEGVGPTASRPGLNATSGNPTRAGRGVLFVDTTLNAIIVFDGDGQSGVWRDALTGAVV